MRSVGIIDVVVPASSGVTRAVELAVQKGGEVGCWILVEHSVFEEISGAAFWTVFRARAVLAHGGGEHGGSSTPADEIIESEFDCVVAGDAARTALAPS